MDPRLLRIYTDELTHLQEVGREFAQAFPQVALPLEVRQPEVRNAF